MAVKEDEATRAVADQLPRDAREDIVEPLHASARSKEDEAFAARAHEETFRLQHGERGERALWQHILRVSVEDLKRNYDNLGVSFDVWLGESDAQKYIPQMLETVKAKGLCVESEGALVVPVQEETDAKEVPPCILVKSDGATLYATTDLATIDSADRSSVRSCFSAICTSSVGTSISLATMRAGNG